MVEFLGEVGLQNRMLHVIMYSSERFLARFGFGAGSIEEVVVRYFVFSNFFQVKIILISLFCPWTYHVNSSMYAVFKLQICIRVCDPLCLLLILADAGA